jgi:hypothetical protein
VVVTLSWPSHRAMTVLSTPAAILVASSVPMLSNSLELMI